jgi:hypothetical protein
VVHVDAADAGVSAPRLLSPARPLSPSRPPPPPPRRAQQEPAAAPEVDGAGAGHWRDAAHALLSSPTLREAPLSPGQLELITDAVALAPQPAEAAAAQEAEAAATQEPESGARPERPGSASCGGGWLPRAASLAGRLCRGAAGSGRSSPPGRGQLQPSDLEPSATDARLAGTAADLLWPTVGQSSSGREAQQQVPPALCSWAAAAQPAPAAADAAQPEEAPGGEASLPDMPVLGLATGPRLNVLGEACYPAMGASVGGLDSAAATAPDAAPAGEAGAEEEAEGAATAEAGAEAEKGGGAEEEGGGEHGFLARELERILLSEQDQVRRAGPGGTALARNARGAAPCSGVVAAASRPLPAPRPDRSGPASLFPLPGPTV